MYGDVCVLRVPSYICERFHYRGMQAKGTRLSLGSDSIESLSTRLSLTPLALHVSMLHAIDSYRLDYDDLDDICRQTQQSKLRWNHYLAMSSLNLWHNLRQPHAHPNAGGWLCLLLNIFYLIHLHALIMVVLVDIVSSPYNPSTFMQEISFRGFYLFFQDPLYRAPLLLHLCIVDTCCCLIYQLLDVIVTCTPRLNHILHIVIHSYALFLFRINMSYLSLLLQLLYGSLPRLSMLDDTAQLAIYYLMFRGFTVLGMLCYRLRMRTHSPILPGCNYDVSSSLHQSLLAVPLPPLPADARALIHDDARPHAIPKQSAFHSSAHSCTNRLYFILRSTLFWLFIIALKLLFDAYILWPSVTGVTSDSLCRSASINPLLAATREALAQEHSWHDIQYDAQYRSIEDTQSTFIGSVACPALVGLLWFGTAVISIATSYVAYIIVLSLFGSFVPYLFHATDRRQRAVIFLLMCLFWLCMLLGLIMGTFAFTIGMTLMIVLISWSMNWPLHHSAYVLIQPPAPPASTVPSLADATATAPHPPGPAKDNSAPATLKSPDNALVHSLRDMFQPLYACPLSVEQTRYTWQNMMKHMRQSAYAHFYVAVAVLSGVERLICMHAYPCVL